MPTNDGVVRGMSDTSETSHGLNEADGRGAMAAARDINAWFVREILPLEPSLLKFLRRSWRNENDIRDLCQDIYVEVYEAARSEFPKSPGAFLFSVARHAVIDRSRRAQIVAIEAVADLETLGVVVDEPGPDQAIIGRQELRLHPTSLEKLPQRWREALVLRKIEGLTRPQIAQRMGIAERTVSQHLASAIVALANIFHADLPDEGGER